MKRKPRTVKEIIHSASPVSVIKSNSIPEKWDEMSDMEKKLLLKKPRMKVSYEIQIKGDVLYFFYKRIFMIRQGAKIFPKSKITNIIVMEGNSVKVKDKAFTDAIFEFLGLMGIKWIDRDLFFRYVDYITSSAILKAILTGRIISEKTLVKRIMSQSLHIKNVEWRVFREFCNTTKEMGYLPNIFDMQEYTKDLNASMKEIIRICKDRNTDYNRPERLKLIADILENAVILDRKIDLKWSDRRMEEEHQKMVCEIMCLSPDHKSNKKIHETVPGEEGITMLNSESEVYKEGLMMSHCIYTNYWMKIFMKEYLAFHYSKSEDCTFGLIRQDDGTVTIDQIKKKRNGLCTEETTNKIKDFVNLNLDMLKSMFDTDDSLAELPF